MAFASRFVNVQASRSYHQEQSFPRVQFNDEETCGCLPGSSKRRRRRDSWRLLKERIRQFSIWYSESKEQRENEHFKLRKQRQLNKEIHVTKTSMKYLRLLYLVDFAIVATGGTFLFCSTIRGIGGNTTFYQNKGLYTVLGVCLLVLSVVLLLLATGIKHKLRKTHLKPRRNFYILEKNKSSKSMLKTQVSIEKPVFDNVDESDMTEMVFISPKHEDDADNAPNKRTSALPNRVSMNTFDPPVTSDDFINTDETRERMGFDRETLAKSEAEKNTSRETLLFTTDIAN